MKRSKERTVFAVVGRFYIGILALVSVLPFLMIISGSFTSERQILTMGYSLIPKQISTAAYMTLFKSGLEMLRQDAIGTAD